MKSTRSYFVGISSSADGSDLRTDTFNNTSYIVVPIVSAVGDQVWWPINSPTPVLILSSVLAAHAATRNFRPVVMGHPKISGDYVSANSPQILQDYSFGFMFNSVFDNGCVKVEAWLNPIRAKEVGPAAENVISRLQAGENVEVSEGNAVLVISETGTFNGKKYGARWISAVSDHLAMLDVNETGACNNEMGCGRLQISKGADNNDNKMAKIIELATNNHKIAALTENKGANNTMNDSNVFARMVAKIRAAMSNNSLRWKLYKAVTDIEPGVQYIDDEDVAAGTFRYVVVISFGYGDYDAEREYHWYQRSFTVDAESNVTVNDDRIELVYNEEKAWVIKPVDNSVEVTDTSMMATTAKSCGCGSKTEPENVPKFETEKGETTVKPIVTAAQKNLASQLITSASAPFEESDRGVLEAMSEEKLGALVKGFEDPTPPVVATSVSALAANTENVVTLTREEYASIRAAADAHSAQIEARKSHLVTSLKAAQSGLLESDLNEMHISTLEKLAVSFRIDIPVSADYSLRGIPESRTSTTVAARKLPDTWGLENKPN